MVSFFSEDSLEIHEYCRLVHEWGQKSFTKSKRFSLLEEGLIGLILLPTFLGDLTAGINIAETKGCKMRQLK